METAILILVLWSLVLVLCSLRLWYIAADLKRQGDQFRRWTQRAYEKDNHQRIL